LSPPKVFTSGALPYTAARLSATFSTSTGLVESNRISSTSDEVDAFIESAGEHRYQTNNGDNTGYRITHFPSFEEWEVYVPQPVGCKWSGKSDVIIFLGCIVENDPGNEDRTEQ